MAEPIKEENHYPFHSSLILSDSLHLALVLFVTRAADVLQGQQLIRLLTQKRIDVLRISRLSPLGGILGFLVDRIDYYECRDPNTFDTCALTWSLLEVTRTAGTLMY